MNSYEDYIKKHDHLNADEKELRRKYYTYLEEQLMPMVEAKQGLTSVSSVSAVAASGGGQASSARTAPAFGVNEFITTWKTDNAGTSASNQITLPIGSVYNPSSGSDYYFQVDWGDESTNIIQSGTDSAKTHTYATAGTYTVKISGIIKGWSFATGNDRLKLTGITQWGCMGLDTWQQFAFCTNMSITASDQPSYILSMGSTFYGCSQIATIPGLGSWDTSECTDMTGTFRQCTIFNQDISAWNTSAVTTTFRMFLDAPAFNQNIGSWNMSNNTNMAYMFNFATAFNNGGSPSINNWNTAKVTNIDSIFRGSGFNQPIGNWNMISCTNLRSIFRDCPFNQDISAWNVSNVTQFPDVFLNNGAVNNLANWNVVNGSNFSRMFANGFGGDFSLGTWDLRNATSMASFVYPGVAKFSTASYDAGLIYWATLPLKTGVNFSIGSTKYSSAAQSARNYIVSTYGWTITDGGLET